MTNKNLHSYQLNVHKTLINPFVVKDKLLNIYKWLFNKTK